MLAAVLVAYLCAGECGASHITLRTTAASSFSNGKASVTVAVSNSGTESAKELRIEASLGDNCARSGTKESLDTNGTFRMVLDLGAPPTPPGLYIVTVRVRYEDADGYPLTAISSVPLFTSDPDLIGETLSARLTAVEIPKTRESVCMTANLQSSCSTTLQVRVSLMLPEELECQQPILYARITPKALNPLVFRILNKAARVGSAYSVPVVIDYEKDGLHHSLTAFSHIRVLPQRDPLSFVSQGVWLCLIFFLLALFVSLQFVRLPEQPFRTFRSVFPYAVLAALLAFTLLHIPPSLLFMDTLTVGGDTVAHNYLASHLGKELLLHGRIVSWTGGWWCGFPMFQFYFCLPYLLVSLLSCAMPFNVAFKIVSVLGILALPACAYASARIMRVPRPGPILLAIAMMPLLFDNSNTMWGVNIYSTFAGMISNSISFPIMLFFVACAGRDADEGKFRLGTVFLLAALIASHFFTTIIAGLVIVLIPLLRPRAGIPRAMAVLAKECGLAFLFMAWWLIPLVAKRAYSMDFGTNWALDLREGLPGFAKALLPLAAVSVPLAIVRRTRFIAVAFWMLASSLYLMIYGYDGISHVFVNVRLWPFVIYSLLALAAVGVGLLLQRFKATEVAATAILLAALVFGPGSPNSVRSWAEWNYEGMEEKPRWPVFRDLVPPLDKTPGRLANDLSARNCSLGSSRIFECVPHLIQKPILEGGIVNSAAGSMFSYYIQGETSENCAGFPSIVTPTTFDFTNATKHLNLFNVKHFIAASDKTKAALAASKDWRLLRECQGWQLYELQTNDGSYVSIPENSPVFVGITDWKRAGLEWIYAIQAIDQPFVLLRPEEHADEQTLTADVYREYLRLRKQGKPASPTPHPTHGENFRIWDEKVTDESISFKTTGIGLPHIVKCTYYPNWKVRGARKVYMVTPCFMLVYPEQREVELYYGYTLSDNIGRVLSLVGLVALVVVTWRTVAARKNARPPQ